MNVSTTRRSPLGSVLSAMRMLPRRVWPAFTAAWGVITGLLPHVLHHAGPLAGAALFAGLGGSLLFFALGVVLAIPFLRRMHRHFGTWRAPVTALAVFVAVFSISTLLVGPRILGESSQTPADITEKEHEDHH